MPRRPRPNAPNKMPPSPSSKAPKAISPSPSSWNHDSTVFVCSPKTEAECLRRMLLGAPAITSEKSSIRNGSILLLLNYQSRRMQGPYLANSAVEHNAVPEAWGGKFPYQVRVRTMPGVAPGSFVVDTGDRKSWRGSGQLSYRDTFECLKQLLPEEDFNTFVDLYMNQRRRLSVQPPARVTATSQPRTTQSSREAGRVTPPPPRPPPPQPRMTQSSREAGRVDTEGVSVISNDHSRQRKAERAVTKRDVQRAKKDGTWSKAEGSRWQCAYDGLVVIFAADKRTAITQYWESERRQAAAELNHERWGPGPSVQRSPGAAAAAAPSASPYLRAAANGVAPPTASPAARQPPSPQQQFDAEVNRGRSCGDASVNQDGKAVFEPDLLAHVIVVMDTSASMKRRDVLGGTNEVGASRLDAAFDSLLRELVDPLLMSAIPGKYRVSIVLMGATAKVPLVERSVVVEEWNGPHHVRRDTRLHRTDLDYHVRLAISAYARKVVPAGNGNYKPALKEAARLMAADVDGTHQVQLFMLTDGRPSDLPHDYMTDVEKHCAPLEAALQNMETMVGPKRFIFQAIGLGANGGDFTVLERLAKAVDVGKYYRSKLSTEALGQAMTKVSTTLTETITATLLDGPSTRRKTERNVATVDRDATFLTGSRSAGTAAPQAPRAQHGGFFGEYGRHHHHVKPSDVKTIKLGAGWEVYEHEDRSAIVRFHWNSTKMDLEIVDLPDGCAKASVAVATAKFSQGAERICRQMALVNSKNEILLELAAKEGRYEEDAEQTTWSVMKFTKTPDIAIRKLAEWHLPFARTQSVAREFAVKFASAVKKGYQNPPPGLPAVLPTLEFIECDIYVLGTGDERKSYFVEAMLPGDWRKFNNNAGGVYDISVITQTMTNTQSLQSQSQTTTQHSLLGPGLGVIREDAEEDSDDESGEKTVDDISSALPQAFTHWSYASSGGKRMVCDLQGTYDPETQSFLLTDPVVHLHTTQKGQLEREFGRTDRGERGFRDFFRTHRCSPICRLLGLEDSAVVTDKLDAAATLAMAAASREEEAVAAKAERVAAYAATQATDAAQVRAATARQKKKIEEKESMKRAEALKRKEKKERKAREAADQVLLASDHSAFAPRAEKKKPSVPEREKKSAKKTDTGWQPSINTLREECDLEKLPKSKWRGREKKGKEEKERKDLTNRLHNCIRRRCEERGQDWAAAKSALDRRLKVSEEAREAARKALAAAREVEEAELRAAESWR